MKMKRSKRLLLLADALFRSPHRVLSFGDFTAQYGAAKSTISEDVAILKEVFKEAELGDVNTYAGAAGGVCYEPCVSKASAQAYLEQLGETLSNKTRLLPGGYFYLTDIISHPSHLRSLGRIVASAYQKSGATRIMTIASKGIPLAQAVAYDLNIPFVIVRRDSKVTEGPTISINYATKGRSRVEKMELTKDSLCDTDRVLLVDDFLNGGGTLTGMVRLVEEFGSQVVGACVLAESYDPKRSLDIDLPYLSLLKVEKSADNRELLAVKVGSLIEG